MSKGDPLGEKGLKIIKSKKVSKHAKILKQSYFKIKQFDKVVYTVKLLR